MTIRAEVEYAVFNNIENIAYLRALRFGDQDPAIENPELASEAELTTEEMMIFFLQWISGIQEGLLMLADHVDQLATG